MQTVDNTASRQQQLNKKYKIAYRPIRSTAKMLIVACHLVFLLWRAAPSDTTSYTALAIKQGLQDYTNSMPLGTNGFLDMVKNSKIFVDNTLFIKELVEIKFKSKLILAPRKLGKTTNLLMLKAFLEPELDDLYNRVSAPEETANYKLFVKGEVTLENGSVQKLHSPLLISNDKAFCDKYLGKHPVIYVTFKDVVGVNYTQIADGIKMAIRRAFHDHRYMISTLERTDKLREVKIFKDFLYDRGDMDYKTAIRFLVQIIHEHYFTRPFVLVDDYEFPIMNAFREPSLSRAVVDDILELIHAIISLTIKDNQSIEQDITTACFELGKITITPWNRLNRIYIVEKRESLQKYFGFSHTLVQELFQLHNISERLTRLAYPWYYAHTFKLTQERYYYPSSIASFVHYRKIDAYWEDHSNIDIFGKIIKNCLYIRRALLAMLSTFSFVNRGRTFLNRDHIHNLQFLFMGRPRQTTGFQGITYLIDQGYMIRNQGAVADNQTHITNHEMAAIFAKKMIWYYKESYHYDTELLHDAALALYNFILCNYFLVDYVDIAAVMIYDLQIHLTNLYANAKKHLIHTHTATPIYSMFNCLMLQIHCVAKFDINIYYLNIMKSDFVVHDRHNRTVIIVQIGEYDESPEPALKEAFSYENITNNFFNLTKIRFIAINVAPNSTVQVAARTKVKINGTNEYEMQNC